ncbi:MAG TPA: hypothetical protein VGK74_19115 [Symbiobacteriaceae bacterium]|jgi:hypothetical protein
MGTAANAFMQGSKAARKNRKAAEMEGRLTAGLARFLRAQERDYLEQAMLYMTLRGTTGCDQDE